MGGPKGGGPKGGGPEGWEARKVGGPKCSPSFPCSDPNFVLSLRVSSWNCGRGSRPHVSADGYWAGERHDGKGKDKGKGKDDGSKPPAATVQAVATVNQIHSSGGSDDSVWIFAVSAPSGRNARILVDSGAE